MNLQIQQVDIFAVSADAIFLPIDGLATGMEWVGATARNAKLAGVRRVHLGGVRYHLYYRVREPEGIVEVLAFWHSNRGVGPRV